MKILPTLLASLLAAALPAMAQNYPTRSVRIVVTAPPGGSADALARVLAERMGRELQQSVVIDNKPGASGMLGADAVAKAAPDGYTMLLTEGASMAINALVRKDLPFQPERDLAPVALVATTPSILVANPGSGATTVKDLVALAKQAPGNLAYGSPGVGTPHHLATVLFAQSAGISLNHVPYKGGGPMVTDVVGGQIPLVVTGVLGTIPFVKSGKLTGVAIGSPQRSPLLPDVPTFAESGFPGFVAEVFFGAYLPAKTPADVAATLTRAVTTSLADPQVRKKLAEQALNVPDEAGAQPLQARYRAETRKWADIVRSSNITLD